MELIKVEEEKDLGITTVLLEKLVCLQSSSNGPKILS